MIGLDSEIIFPLQNGRQTVFFLTNARYVDGNVGLSMEMQICTDLFMTCLQPIEVFQDIKFVQRDIAIGGKSKSK